MAEALGAGDACWENVQLRELNTPKQGEYIPNERKVVEVCDAVEEVESCSACYGYLLPALWRLKEEGLLQNLTEKICIGQGYHGKGRKTGSRELHERISKLCERMSAYRRGDL